MRLPRAPSSRHAGQSSSPGSGEGSQGSAKRRRLHSPASTRLVEGRQGEEGKGGCQQPARDDANTLATQREPPAPQSRPQSGASLPGAPPQSPSGAVGDARLLLQLRYHARQPAAQAAGLGLRLVAHFFAAYKVWLGVYVW